MSSAASFTPSAGSGSKLKKFNINITPIHTTANNANDSESAEQLKLKQDHIRLQNDAEKERNRRLVHDLIKPAQTPTHGTNNPGLLRKSFLCQLCHKSASITERVRLQGLVYHRECMRCCKCNSVVKNPENFTRRSEADQISFYCAQHANGLKSLSVCPIEMESDCGESGPRVKCLLDTELIRQRALEKARLKSDEELGIKMTPRRVEIVSGVVLRGRKEYESKTESTTDSDGGEYETRTEDDLFIDGEASEVLKKLVLEEFDQEYASSRSKGKLFFIRF